jgi:predicted Zn finger-like uncharacterized protein
MILTCPRCATRYLVDPLQVWSGGRNVQCDACGQRWRAVGEGVRPQPEREPEPERDSEPLVAEEPSPVEASEVEAESRTEAAAAASAPDSPGPREEATPIEAVEPQRDWHAALPDTPPATDLTMTREALMRKAPQPLTSSFASRSSGAGRWLAVVFLVMIVLAALVMFRDLVVRAFPGLAPIYASMGLLVHPAAAAHG